MSLFGNLVFNAEFDGELEHQKVVKDGGKACFTCHIPHADNGFVITRDSK